MVVHVLGGQWPFPGEAVRTNPDNPSNLIAVSEYDRRESTIKLIKDTHPLMSLIKRCLSNSPSLRPTASEVHQQVSTVADNNPPSFANKVVMLETIEVVNKEKETLRIEKEGMELEKEIIINERDRAVSENAVLISQIKKIQEEISDLTEANMVLLSTVQEKDQQINRKTEKLNCLEAALVSRNAGLKNGLDCTMNCSDLFTQEAKLSVCKCAAIEIPWKEMALHRSLCTRDGVYVAYSPMFKGPSGGLIHYSCDSNIWHSLPIPPVRDYNLGYLFGKLLALGGHDTSDVYEFDETAQEWVKSATIPPMPTARSHATVATWITPDVSALIVCGGKDHKSNTVSTVEVFHSVTSEWHTSAPSLPHRRHSMKYTIVQNTLFLVGGHKTLPKYSAFSIFIPDLLETIFLNQSASSDDDMKWHVLPDVPSAVCLPVSHNGQHLLAIGQTTVYIYCPTFSSWVKLGSLPFSNRMYDGIIAGTDINSDELLLVELTNAHSIWRFTVSKIKITNS